MAENVWSPDTAELDVLPGDVVRLDNGALMLAHSRIGEGLGAQRWPWRGWRLIVATELRHRGDYVMPDSIRLDQRYKLRSLEIIHGKPASRVRRGGVVLLGAVVACARDAARVAAWEEALSGISTKPPPKGKP